MTYAQHFVKNRIGFIDRIKFAEEMVFQKNGKSNLLNTNTYSINPKYTMEFLNDLYDRNIPSRDFFEKHPEKFICRDDLTSWI